MYKDKESLNFLSKINVDEFYEKNKPKGEFVICISSLKEN